MEQWSSRKEDRSSVTPDGDVGEPQAAYAASVTTTKETRDVEVDTKPLFVDAASAMLDFFAAVRAQVDRRKTMAILRILEAARDPAATERFVKL